MFRRFALFTLLALLLLPACGKQAREIAQDDELYLKSVKAEYGEALVPDGDGAELFALTPDPAWIKADETASLNGLALEAKPVKGAWKLTLSAPEAAPRQGSLLLHYDPQRVRLDSTEFDAGFAASNLTLSVPGIRGIVPLAFASHAEGEYDGTIAEVRFAPGAETSRELYQTHPPNFAPQYLTMHDDGVRRVLNWLELNPGDFNKDGTVNGMDLFPLASRYLQESNWNGHIATTEGNDCIDGNHDGSLTGLDLFMIAANFNSQVGGFNLYKSNDGGDNYTLVDYEGVLERRDPQLDMCWDWVYFEDWSNYFEPTQYYVTHFGETQGDESPASGVVDDEMDWVSTIEQNMSAAEDVLRDEYGTEVRVPAGTFTDGDILYIGTLINPDFSGDFAVDSLIVNIDFGGPTTTWDPLTVRIPYFGYNPDEVGIAMYDYWDEQWETYDPMDLNVMPVNDFMGYVEFEAGGDDITFATYQRGGLWIDVNASTTYGPGPLEVQFGCRAGGGSPPYSYEWDFGDGMSSDEKCPTHSFEPGVYVAYCTVTDATDETEDSWRIQVIADGDLWTTATIHEGSGIDTTPQIVFDDDDNPIVAFTEAEDFILAQWHGAWWTSEAVPDIPASRDFDMEIAGDGSLSVSFWDEASDSLRAAWNGQGPWLVDTVDAGPGCGRGSSIAVHDNGQPYICYRDAAGGSVNFAYHDGDEWVTMEIEADQASSATWPTGVAYSQGGQFPVAAWPVGDPANLVRGGRWYQGNWEIGDAASPVSLGPDFSLDIEWDWLGYAYQDLSSGRLMLGYNDEGDFYNEVIDPGRPGDNNCLALSGHGVLGVAYHDTAAGELILAWFDDWTYDWHFFTLTDDVDVSQGIALAWDHESRPLVVYTSGDGNSLMATSTRDFTSLPGDHDPPVWDDTTGIQRAFPWPEGALIAWNTASDAESGPVRYNVYYDTVWPMSGGAVKLEDVTWEPGFGYDCQYLITGLTQGTEYFFMVRAEDSAAPSNEDGNSAYQPAFTLDAGGPFDWEIETVDSDGYVGTYTSLVYNGWGEPQIGYRHESMNAVRTARKMSNTTWFIQIPEATLGTGYYTTLVSRSPLLENMAYFDNVSWILRWAYYDPVEGWMPGVVDSSGVVGEFCDSTGGHDMPYYVSYYDRTNTQLKLARRSAAWNNWVVDTDGDVGQWTSIDHMDSTSPLIAYRDVTNSSLKLARCHYDGSWTFDTETVDDSADVGHYNSLVHLGGGDVAIAYFDQTNLQLKIAISDGGDWMIGVVDSEGETGHYADLCRGPDGQLFIGYTNAGPWDQRLAWYHDGYWMRTTVDADGITGMHCSVAYDAVNERVGVSYHNQTGLDLMLAQSPLP